MDYLDFSKVIYTGDKQNNEPHGTGIMRFESGCTYRGGFKCGQFDGDGELEFPEGKLIGKWDNGRQLEYRIIFRDELEFQEGKWDYITPSDRRYYNEITNRVPVAASREKPNDFKNESEMRVKETK
ncbi:Dynein-like_protein [Hexamita inflata]|uniref:Dynein-like protein n=1 Tax=Hexamita inflata TaxID=28002 RepID=A0AA86NPX4_9EUKA|nr:Dynein-like protein [Hexamita inflata]CAI9948883.1 Dynein-like protein [Hexamita inflata]CAI9951012.1 Dynein-like protein [Hexamita inflata]CAI9958318.1 Dynein-like protein [Hexamita inflata]